VKKFPLLLVIMSLAFATASAQKNIYKIFEKKRGTAYEPYLLGADEKYIFIRVPGQSMSSQHKNTASSLTSYSVKDLTQVKTRETEFTYNGKDFWDSHMTLFGKYIVLFCSDNLKSKNAKPENSWVALDKASLEPVKAGTFADKYPKTIGGSVSDIAISPDGNTLTLVYEIGEGKSMTTGRWVACYDRDMNKLWETEYKMPEGYNAARVATDNNQTLYILCTQIAAKGEKDMAGKTQLLTLRDKAATKDTKSIALSGKFIFSSDMKVAGDGTTFIGGLYSASAQIQPAGVFTIRVAADGAITVDEKAMSNLPDIYRWNTTAGLSEAGEFFFRASHKISYSSTNTGSGSSSALNEAYSLMGGYVAVFADAAGKIQHEMNWNHIPIPEIDISVAISQAVENGKPYLFTDYSDDQLDDWGDKNYSTEQPKKKATTAYERTICQVTDVDHPDAKKPVPLFTLDKSYFACNNAKYIPSLKTMIFFGCVTGGKNSKGWTNFWLGKSVLSAN
jgi:hypothetical protein